MLASNHSGKPPCIWLEVVFLPAFPRLKESQRVHKTSSDFLLLKVLNTTKPHSLHKKQPQQPLQKPTIVTSCFWTWFSTLYLHFAWTGFRAESILRQIIHETHYVPNIPVYQPALCGARISGSFEKGMICHHLKLPCGYKMVMAPWIWC